MNYPRKGSAGSSTVQELKKWIFIRKEQPTEEDKPTVGSIWIEVDENKVPYSVYRYTESKTWERLNVLEQNIVVSKEEPINKYPNLVWFVLDGENKVSSIKVWIEEESTWKEVQVGSSESFTGLPIDTYQVKATSTDSTPGFLNEKVDNQTIQVKDNKLSVKFQDDKTKDVVWSSQRVTKEAIIKAIIFG